MPKARQQTSPLGQFMALEHVRLTPWHGCPSAMHAAEPPPPPRPMGWTQQLCVAESHVVVPHVMGVPVAPPLLLPLVLPPPPPLLPLPVPPLPLPLPLLLLPPLPPPVLLPPLPLLPLLPLPPAPLLDDEPELEPPPSLDAPSSRTVRPPHANDNAIAEQESAIAYLIVAPRTPRAG